MIHLTFPQNDDEPSETSSNFHKPRQTRPFPVIPLQLTPNYNHQSCPTLSFFWPLWRTRSCEFMGNIQNRSSERMHRRRVACIRTGDRADSVRKAEERGNEGKKEGETRQRAERARKTDDDGFGFDYAGANLSIRVRGQSCGMKNRCIRGLVDHRGSEENRVSQHTSSVNHSTHQDDPSTSIDRSNSSMDRVKFLSIIRRVRRKRETPHRFSFFVCNETIHHRRASNQEKFIA